MTLDAFINLIERCGADETAWPPGARAGAARLLEASETARRALSDLREAEGLYRALPRAASDRDFAALAMAGPQDRRVAGAGVRWAAAAAVVLALGVAVGAASPRGDDAAAAVSSALNGAGETLDGE